MGFVVLKHFVCFEQFLIFGLPDLKLWVFGLGRRQAERIRNRGNF